MMVVAAYPEFDCPDFPLDVRWFVRAWRHYALDGETAQLAPLYGYRYNPGHLKDPDFDNGFANWEAHPAADGALKPFVLKGYGTKVEARKDVPDGFGDRAALFTRGADRGSVLWTKLTGLKPDALYSVCYYATRLELAEERLAGKKIPQDEKAAELQFVIEDGGTEWVQLQTRRHPPKGVVGTYRNVFRATSSEATVALDDFAAKPGAKTLLNGICVRPYFNDLSAAGARLGVR